MDVEQVGVVLRHLLDNAISRTEHGSRVLIRARLGLEEVAVTLEEQRPVTLLVGAALEPLSMGRSSLSLAGTSMPVGPGFEHCERIVSRHGGRLWVEESSRQSERVTFTLPLSGSAALVTVG